MRRRPAAALPALACAVCLGPMSSAATARPLGLVHAGVPATDGERPFQAAVLEAGVPICGGVVLDAWRIASAAHCVFGSDQSYLVAQTPAALRVFAGSVRLGGGGQVVDVAQVSFDPRFDARSFDYDVAVLRLERPLVLDGDTAPLAPAAATPPDATPAVVSGWGEIRDDDPYQPGRRYPDTLRIGELRTVSDASCAAAYPELPPAADVSLCTTSADPGARTDACQGDSGGPLTSGGLLVGIVSSGTDCGHPAYPGVQTEVAEPGVHAFLLRTDLPPAPRPTAPLAISGTPRAGELLRCESAAWSGRPVLRVQWLREGGRLPDVAVSAPSHDPGFKPSGDDVGHRLFCVVRAANEGGYGVQASALTAAIEAGPAPAPPPAPAPVEDLRPVPPPPTPADGARPVVRVPRAACVARTRRCTVTATVADRRPSAGIARLEVRLTSTYRSTCSRRAAGRTRRVPCIRSFARTLRPMALGNLTFRVDASRLRYGRHRFVLVAVDRAGHRSLPVGRTVALSRPAVRR